MSKAIKNYIFLQVISFVVICVLVNIAYYLNLNLASDTITSHIRNDLLIRDFKSVQFNLSFSKNSGFSHVEVRDSNRKILLATSDLDLPMWEKAIYKKIKINQSSSLFIYKIVFYYDLLKPFIYSFIGLSIFSVLTIPYVFLENKRIKKEIEIEKIKIKNEEIRKAALQVFHDIRSPLAALNSVASTLPEGASFEKNILIRSIDQMNHMSEAMLARSRGEERGAVTEFDIVGLLKTIVSVKNISHSGNRIKLVLNNSGQINVEAEKK